MQFAICNYYYLCLDKRPLSCLAAGSLLLQLKFGYMLHASNIVPVASIIPT